MIGTDSPIAFPGYASGSTFMAPTWVGQNVVNAQPHGFDLENMVLENHHNASVKTDRPGTNPKDFGEEFIYERTWITPNLEAFGMLLSEQIRTINFWNAYKDRSVILSAITGYLDCTGTSIHDVDLPDTYTPTAEGSYVLTVTINGSSTLDCYYLFVNDSPHINNRLDITGTRILFLPFRHNWERTYRIKYNAETVISTTTKLCEQRRPLFATLRREIAASDLFASGIKIKNYLKAYLNHIIALPIVTEAMTINLSGALTGLTTLPINETISDFWNLAHSDHVALWNTATEETEICELDSYTTSLVLHQPILNTWNAAHVVIYPIMISVLTNNRIDSITDQVDEISITAKEFR